MSTFIWCVGTHEYVYHYSDGAFVHMSMFIIVKMVHRYVGGVGGTGVFFSSGVRNPTEVLTKLHSMNRI